MITTPKNNKKYKNKNIEKESLLTFAPTLLNLRATVRGNRLQ